METSALDLTTLNITKPFDHFKWRWMELAPVESLNRSDIFIGVVRAIQACEGLRASDEKFIAELAQIQADLDRDDEKINLVPSDTSRNLIRRQGRYWSGTGVLARSGTGLTLTDLGRNLADGTITSDEFVSDFIVQHTVPNEYIEKDEILEEYKANAISIKPLVIILEALGELSKIQGQGFLMPDEVITILVPLSILNAKLKSSDYAKAVMNYRSDSSAADKFPDCTPRANDKRFVREHLLFLKNFDVLNVVFDESQRDKNFRELYSLSELGIEILKVINRSSGVTDTGSPSKPTSITKPIIHKQVDFGSVRTKKLASVTSRPNQAKFRKLAISAYDGTCALTGETVPDVVIACHIVDHANGGPDSLDNAICLRADIHTLYDRGKLRISKNGDIALSHDLTESPSYADLPIKIEIPDWVNKEYLDKKFKYGSTRVS
jgi:hypothetical protein